MTHPKVFLLASALLVIILTAATANAAFNEDTSWTGSVSNDWNTAGNWDNGVPGSADRAVIDDPAVGSSLVVDESVSAEALQFGFNDNSDSNPTVTTGGSINLSSFLTMAQGNNANVTFTMSDGSINTGGNISVGYHSQAVFDITGGEVTISGALRIGASSNGNGHVNLDGGAINTANLLMRQSSSMGTMDITEGTLIINGEWSSTSDFFKDGWITAYDGSGTLNFSFDAGTNKTTITAVAGAAASGPNPDNDAENVSRDVALSWVPGDDAVDHDVYFDTNFDDVNDGTIPDANTGDVNSYNPGTLALSQIYYWRIDANDGSTIHKGNTWHFTVDRGIARILNPGNGAEGVAVDANLSWTAGAGAISHDVYFGTSFSNVNNASDPNTLPGRGRRGTTSYDPCDFELGQVYYWRIDEFHGDVTAKGDVWQFTVTDVDPRFASNPSPADLAGNVLVDAILSWSTGTGAISHDVYFGVDFNDVNDGTSFITTIDVNFYDPCGLEYLTLYYWRVDEDDGSITRKGEVWSFTTKNDLVMIEGLPAFPGAKGYGAFSLGGRGGDVYHVTTLADYNEATEANIPGSLRWGVRSASGPRTIVFDVSGYIDLKYRIEITKPNLTIAGQTAPGDGITVRHWDLRLYDTNNIIARYFRIRTGRFADQLPILNISIFDPNHLHGGLDCLSVEGSTDVILDHLSMSWSSDEIGSVTGDSNNVTVQWCTFAEPLNWWDNGHAYGSLLRPGMNSKLTHHHNLYSDCRRRVTRFGNYNDNVTTRFDWYNNVAYNWESQSTYSSNGTGPWNYEGRYGHGSGGADGEFVEINMMDNYFIAGPSTSWSYAYYGANADDHKIWAENNFWDDDKLISHNGSDGGWGIIGGSYDQQAQAFDITSPSSISDAETAYDKVLDMVGASIVRDTVDVRIINEVNDRSGFILHDQNSLGADPYPVLNEVSRNLAVFDTDLDGMPNAWELARGFDPNKASDGNGDFDGDGYTNLEEYLNYLAIQYGSTPGDFDNDDDVDAEDLFFFIDDWLVHDPCYVPAGHLYGDDDFVDWRDFAIFADNWSG